MHSKTLSIQDMRAVAQLKVKIMNAPFIETCDRLNVGIGIGLAAMILWGSFLFLFLLLSSLSKVVVRKTMDMCVCCSLSCSVSEFIVPLDQSLVCPHPTVKVVDLCVHMSCSQTRVPSIHKAPLCVSIPG